MTDAVVSVRYGILCEDIRREDNGKHILIGMYGRNIELTTIPGHLALALLLAIDATGPGTSKIEVVGLLNNDQVSKAAGEIRFDAEGLILLPLPTVPVLIENQGALVFRAKLEDGEWVDLWKGPVALRGSPSSQA